VKGAVVKEEGRTAMRMAGNYGALVGLIPH